jgi:hypothetical protein
MTFIRNFLVGLSMFAISCAILVGKNGEAKLALEVKPVKPVFQTGDPIDLHFVLRNVGNRNVIVARTLRLTANIKLEIQDAQGQSALWCGRIAEWADSSRSYVNLAPGQSVSATLTASCVNKENKSRSWGYTVDKPGKYVAKATYRLPRPKEYYEKLFPEAEVVRGPILAQPISIELR